MSSSQQQQPWNEAVNRAIDDTWGNLGGSGFGGFGGSGFGGGNNVKTSSTADSWPRHTTEAFNDWWSPASLSASVSGGGYGSGGSSSSGSGGSRGAGA